MEIEQFALRLREKLADHHVHLFCDGHGDASGCQVLASRKWASTTTQIPPGGRRCGKVLANALFHGNLEVGSKLRELDTNAYHDMAQRRRHELPYQERRFEVQAGLGRNEPVFVVCNRGRGFDPSALPDPTNPANLEKASGRGILLRRRMDFSTGARAPR